ncbi:MAG: DUF2971 domain-containing protein [Chloroflexi bacterium]|nr:DUF2971 domain-containing protein [Chloroflexota bacterium]
MRSVWTNDEVAPDQPLWRYLRAQRFIESVQSRTLHFPSARQFEDPFEGAVAVLPYDWPRDPRYEELGDVDKAFEQLRRLTKISCWHCADYESDAMWKLYAGTRKGVAIRTTAARLQAALRPFRLAADYGEEQPIWGRVRYFDLHAERLRAGMEERFFIKHRAFEWEQEFRVVISVRMAEEFGVAVPVTGIDVPFDPAVLVESAHLGPSLSDSERAAISDVCAAAGLGARLSTSTLLGRPRYT